MPAYERWLRGGRLALMRVPAATIPPPGGGGLVLNPLNRWQLYFVIVWQSCRHPQGRTDSPQLCAVVQKLAVRVLLFNRGRGRYVPVWAVL